MASLGLNELMINTLIHVCKNNEILYVNFISFMFYFLYERTWLVPLKIYFLISNGILNCNLVMHLWVTWPWRVKQWMIFHVIMYTQITQTVEFVFMVKGTLLSFSLADRYGIWINKCLWRFPFPALARVEVVLRRRDFSSEWCSMY